MKSLPIKSIIHGIIVFVLYFSQVPAFGMWKATDRKVLTAFQHNFKKTVNIQHIPGYICNSYSINVNTGRMRPNKRPSVFTDTLPFKKSIRIYPLSYKSQNVANFYSQNDNLLSSNTTRGNFSTFLQNKNDSTLDYQTETPSSGIKNFNVLLKKVEKIILDNLNDKEVKNQLCALNSINLFASSANLVDRFLKGGLLTTLFTVLEKPYEKSIWKFVNTYIWPSKPLQSPEVLTVQELVLKILISLSTISDKLRKEMVDNESLKKTLLKIYCLYSQLQSQEGKEPSLSSSERDKVKNLIDDLFLSLGYKVDEKITLVSPKVKETDTKEESWTWEKILPFSSSEENGSNMSIKDYLIPVKSTKRTAKQAKSSKLVWIPYYYTQFDSRESILRNLRINLGNFERVEGLDDLSNLTLKPFKVSSKNPELLGLLAVNVKYPATSGGDFASRDPLVELQCNINMESSHDLNLGMVTERLLGFMDKVSDFRILNDIFTELWSLLGVKSKDVLDVLYRRLDLDLVSDIVNYSCFDFDSDSYLSKNYYLPNGFGLNLGVNEKVSNIFGRLNRLREMVKDHFEKSPKGSIANMLYNFVNSNAEDTTKISVDLDEISNRMDHSKRLRLDKFKDNTIEDAKVLQMTLFGFLVELIYLDGNRTFIKIRDHEGLIEAVRKVQNTLKEPVNPDSIDESDRDKYRPLIDKRLELKSVATNVVSQENLNADYSLFNSYKGLVLNGIDFLDIRMNSWKKQRQCLKEDFGPIYNSNKLLNILGYHHPHKFENRGVRILAIDGGGSKGVVALEILKELYDHLKRPLHECFDIICGTSTGGLLASLIALEKMEIEEIQKLYDSLIKSIFVRDSYHVTGTRLLMKQAIYDDNIFKDLLKTSLEEIELIDYSVDRSCPKFFCVSTQMDITPLRPIIWRNYNYHKNIYSLSSKDGYTVDEMNKLMELNGGSCTIRLRDAIKATTSALGYFPLFERNGHLYGDGALYCNNPSVVSLIESKLLFPDTPVELLLSVGNGISKLTSSSSNGNQKTNNTDKEVTSDGVKEENTKSNAKEEYLNSLIKLYENCMDHGSDSNNLNKKENKILSLDQLITHLTYAATTSEMTHSALEFTMPKDVYYRFSPIISSVKIDETNTNVLNTIKSQAKEYLSQDHIRNKFNLIRKLINNSK